MELLIVLVSLLLIFGSVLYTYWPKLAKSDPTRELEWVRFYVLFNMTSKAEKRYVNYLRLKIQRKVYEIF